LMKDVRKVRSCEIIQYLRKRFVFKIYLWKVSFIDFSGFEVNVFLTTEYRNKSLKQMLKRRGEVRFLYGL
jgi:hypothetical protein